MQANDDMYAEHRLTPIRVVDQGDVDLAHGYAYGVTGSHEAGAVCFYISPRDRAGVAASSEVDGCPSLHLEAAEDGDSTIISFPAFPGWRVHAADGGKVISVALSIPPSFARSLARK